MKTNFIVSKFTFFMSGLADFAYLFNFICGGFAINKATLSSFKKSMAILRNQDNKHIHVLAWLRQQILQWEIKVLILFKRVEDFFLNFFFIKFRELSCDRVTHYVYLCPSLLLTFILSCLSWHDINYASKVDSVTFNL